MRAAAFLVGVTLSLAAAACTSSDPSTQPSVSREALGSEPRTWSEQTWFNIDDRLVSDESFGRGVFDDSVAIITASRQDGPDKNDYWNGAAYAFERQAGGFEQVQKLRSSDHPNNADFGNSIALDGDTLLIAAYGTANLTGAAYVFTRVGSTWLEQQKLTASDAKVGEYFGYDVALRGDTAIIGGDGQAYVFTRTGGVWTEQQILTTTGAVGFGYHVAISGDSAVITDPDIDSAAGAAFVFVESGGKWTEKKKLVADDAREDQHFGRSLAFDGDTVLMSDFPIPYADNTVYAFVGSGANWSLQQKLSEPDSELGQDFGNPVKLRGDRAMLSEGGPGFLEGQVVVYERSAGVWSEKQRLQGSKTGDAHIFHVMALRDDEALFGTSEEGGYRFHYGSKPGVACSVADDCALGVCSSEGVCCDRACDACESCLASRKGGGEDGVCDVIPVDTDPRAACAVEAESSCGSSGACDGAGACTLYSTATECDPKSCPTPTSENARDLCDGAGACVANADVACEVGYACVAGACKTSCEADADCDAANAFVCGSGICKVPSAEPCSVDGDCDSGHCADGLCCDKACTGQCEACAEPKHEGICVAAAGEPRGAREACDSAGDAACAARCDGIKRGACQYAPASSSCGCADESSAKRCDGQGYCLDAALSCAGFVCSNDACLTECQGNLDCATAYRCDSGKCVASSSGAHCRDDLSESIGADASRACAPFLCNNETGSCLERCESTADCAGSALCDSETQKCVGGMDAATEDEGCGCRAAGAPRGQGSRAALALLLAAGLACSSRRFRRGPRQVLS